ncbi:hypothetical protein CSB45_08410 [candidate division KSB3 bacterium]|uniref:Fimbrial protein n=1 Tax=candidate division KSB3 bacterium TaxID=2044937 RepID=A0A2G6E631_9BACT|nr:MAG: hypothetical protein CSB45_08410 [candidate division KSB3 bacterium]PIE29760.1 MAG: hypothetical protein CSA57_06805 [candidate division KSB3 bacterium]
MIKINLLPKEARKRAGLGQQIAMIILVLLATIVAIGFTWNYLDNVIEKKNAEIAKTRERLQELQKIIDEINQFEAQRKALEQKLAVIAKLEKEQKLPVHLLDEVYLTLEDDLWLRNFQEGNFNITISGTALSNPVLSDYLRNLEESQYFDNVELVVSQRKTIGAQTVRDFQIKMKLTPLDDENDETTKDAE